VFYEWKQNFPSNLPFASDGRRFSVGELHGKEISTTVEALTFVVSNSLACLLY
jgi:hypothetical protein